jgi:peptidyl-prolyl cis-trans isomerase SurA
MVQSGNPAPALVYQPPGRGGPWSRLATCHAILEKRMRRAVILLSAALLGVPPLGAQEPVVTAGSLVDRVVAVVGDSAIFYSQVREDVRRNEASGVPIPTDTEALRAFEREILDDLVARNLILQAAANDTLVAIPDDRLEVAFQDAWADEIRRFGTEDELRRVLANDGLTITQHRANRREEVRNQLLFQRYFQVQRQQVRVPPVEEGEIRAFFERESAALGSRPATISFRQVVLLPQPSDEAREEARAEAERLLNLLREGEDFADLARRFSNDPGSGQRGGELGWIRQGETVPEFEDALFRLGRGQLSEVVETAFGAHIIRLERIRGPERLAHHILIAALPGPADVQRARDRSMEIRGLVQDGAPLSDFADEGEQTEVPNQLTLTLEQLGQLPGAYGPALRTAVAGDVLGPIEFTSYQGTAAFGVVVVDEIREAGAFTYEDVRDQIREILQNERFEQRLLDRLMAQSHVEIRW